MDATLLDTDILSEVLKQRDAHVMANASIYLKEHGQFTFSAFSRFEVRRGYVERGATSQLARFEVFCEHSLVLSISEAVFDRACALWAEARRGGHPCGDADLLIAATALEHNLALTSGNLRHYRWVPQLKLADWRTE
jgi:tRNA(fMet)-specific endonuclease VapC